ncbi:MAG: FAD:protein FMN transferase [Desulfobacterales bacterium]|nr:FAD:protein FMN transferase [Desulfobacterales bacterium]
MKKNIQILSIIFFVSIFTGCNFKKEVLFSGKTMGTTYHIKVVTWCFQNKSDLKDKIDAKLEAINQSMSIYRKDSEVSRFNSNKNINEKISVSEDFLLLMEVAKNLYKITDGAWDATIKPLVNIWGFGVSGKKDKIPGSEEIHRLLCGIGFNYIEIFEKNYLVKTKADITIDLSSIAKGYGVDRIAELIKNCGIQNYIVEIGGEVFASGFRKDGKPWRVGVNQPREENSYDSVYKILSLHDQALATSGDYRNFFEINGKRYSHVLDPRTGYPVSNGVVSVSIIANTCTFADGLATAVMVMGVPKGLELVNRLEGVECLIVVQEKDGTLKDYYSTGFQTTS